MVKVAKVALLFAGSVITGSITFSYIAKEVNEALNISAVKSNLLNKFNTLTQIDQEIKNSKQQIQNTIAELSQVQQKSPTLLTSFNNSLSSNANLKNELEAIETQFETKITAEVAKITQSRENFSKNTINQETQQAQISSAQKEIEKLNLEKVSQINDKLKDNAEWKAYKATLDDIDKHYQDLSMNHEKIKTQEELLKKLSADIQVLENNSNTNI